MWRNPEIKRISPFARWGEPGEQFQVVDILALPDDDFARRRPEKFREIAASAAKIAGLWRVDLARCQCCGVRSLRTYVCTGRRTRRTFAACLACVQAHGDRTCLIKIENMERTLQQTIDRLERTQSHLDAQLRKPPEITRPRSFPECRY